VKIMWTDAAADHLEKGKLFRQKTEEPRGNSTKQLENVTKRTAKVQSSAEQSIVEQSSVKQSRA